MPIMTNAEAFQYDFGIYATELWAMTEAQFLEWLNANCDRERPADMIVRCKDCRFYRFYDGVFGKGWMCFENNTARHGDDYCSRGERKDNE